MLTPIPWIDEHIAPEHREIEHHHDDEIDHRMWLERIETHPDDESEIEYEKWWEEDMVGTRDTGTHSGKSEYITIVSQQVEKHKKNPTPDRVGFYFYKAFLLRTTPYSYSMSWSRVLMSYTHHRTVHLAHEQSTHQHLDCYRSIGV